MCPGLRVRLAAMWVAAVLPGSGLAADSSPSATRPAPDAAVQRLADLLDRYPDWPYSTGDMSAGQPSAREVLEAMRALDDARLRSAMRDARGERLELFFTEVIRRGGKDWRDYLVHQRQAQEQARAEEAKQKGPVFPLGNVEWLTAVRRLEGKPDPLHIVVAGKRTRSCKLGYLPTFLVLLTNVDRDKAEVLFTEGGNYRTGRQARWRFEVTDPGGNALACRPPPAFGTAGGVCTIGTLEYGESWVTHLDMNKFVEITAPGKYTLRILYHDDVTIANRKDVAGLIMSTSLPIRLVVEPITVHITKREIAAVRKAIAQLPTEGRTKLLGGAYGDRVHDFISPDSPAGQLLEMDWKAVPGLIDAALDDKMNPARRAWVLALLASLTNHNNPRDEAGVLGPYEFRDSGWSVWGGTPGAMSGGLGVATGSFDNRPIDPARQRTFAKRWAVWKERQYVRVEISRNQ